MATSAEWTGVIVVGLYNLDCRLFSAFGKARLFPIKYVHTECHTAISEPVPEKKEEKEIEVSEELPQVQISEAVPEKKDEKEELSSVQVREQLFCPKCQRPIKTDEVGRGIETEAGIIEVPEAEIATLKFEPTKKVIAELIQADDPAIEAVGFGRRLYVFPKPAALEDYASIYYILRESKRVGFISSLVIKQKPHVAVLRPLNIPAVVFGREYPILVSDVLNDTDCLKNPAEFPDYPAFLPSLNLAALAQPIAEAQKIGTKLDPERCVNPKRLKLKEIIKRAVALSLKK